MATVILQLLGVLIFSVGTLICGKLIRRKVKIEDAGEIIRIVHFLFWFVLVLPFWVGFFYPGLTKFDSVLGFWSLSGNLFFLVIGSLLLLVGIFYSFASSGLLLKIGRGAAAFKFSKKVVTGGVYGQVRNPMAFGYYTMALGVSFMAHSTYLIMLNLLLVIPAHIFYIKYFEEYEVERRLGEPYKQYKKKVPFIIPMFSTINKHKNITS